LTVKRNEQERHLEELLLPYIEDTLAESEKAKVADHLSHCRQCSGEVQAIRGLVHELKSAREVFCPESWQLYEWARSGRPEGLILRHVDLCGACAKEVQGYQTESISDRMPDDLWRSVKSALGRENSRPANEGVGTSLWEKFYAWFKIPAVALSAVAAIFLVVVIYPHTVQKPYIVGLSGETWEGAFKPKAVRPKAAIVLMYKDIDNRPSQERIDTIYRALEPGMDVSEAFEIVAPAVLSNAIKSGKVDPYDRDRMLKDLNQQLGVTTAVLVTIVSSNGRTDARVEKVETLSGKVTGSADLGDINKDAARQLRASVKQLILE
jgi:hypothetical protein